MKNYKEDYLEKESKMKWLLTDCNVDIAYV